MPLTPNQALPYQVGADQLGPEGAEALARAVEPLLVMVFASAADRSARVSVPREGMLCWLQDVKRYEQRTGTSWVEIPNLTRVQGMIDLYDSRPKGRINGTFANAEIALTSTYKEIIKVTFSNPSSARVYSWYYVDLYYSGTGSDNAADIITTIASGSSASSGAPIFTTWQLPVQAGSTANGVRIPLMGRGKALPFGTVTLGVFAKISVGTGIIASGAKVLEVDDVGT